MTPTAGSGRFLCFGELLLRLSPANGELLLQSPVISVRPGGAEANVAVSLARLGAPASLATLLPDNVLGRAARDEVRRHGVDVSPVKFGPGRMGLYFMTPGAVRRPSDVVYDRRGSVFAESVDAAFDWDSLLAGARCLHVSGVTPATGPAGSAAAVAICEAAVRLGVEVSYDGNFRGKLWAEWSGEPRETLRAMMATASIAFADDRDFALVLGRSFPGETSAERRRAAARAAFEAFPRLNRIACTQRTQDSVADQALSGVMFVRDGSGVIEISADAIHMAGVVDRVGGGDAFAAGLLFGLWKGWTDAEALDFALHASVLKHSVPGDFSLFSEAEVRAGMDSPGLDIRR